MLRVHVRDLDGEREAQFEGGVIVAGREPDVHMRLNDPLVSRRHARFELRPDGWYVLDLGSRNGSAWNGQRLAPAQAVRLRPGDVLQFGNAFLTVLAAEPAPGAVASAATSAPEATLAASAPVSPSARPTSPSPPSGVGAQGGQSEGASRPAHVGVADNVIHVGRALDNDIVINDAYVSSYHLEAWPQGGGMMVRDLGSRNGTFVDGQRITEQLLPLTAVLQLGPNVTLPVMHLMQRLAAGPEPSLFMRRPTELGYLMAGVGLGRVVGKERKVILRDVDVCVRRGQFIAIVGGSGAGKTTLMKVLNGYTPPDTGALYLARNAQGGEEEIGYVPQEDIIHRELPLREAIVLSALLRYPPGTPRELVERRAEEVLAQLGLAEHQHTLVGRLSGGQRKRASVALELMRNPPLLILDEPTSGLDPASGRRLIKLLRSLANSGVGILLVTHAMENVEDVDTIAFLAPGGVLVFWGTLEEARQHFGTADLASVYELLDPDGAGPEEKRAAVARWRQRFLESEYYRRLHQEVEEAVRALAPMARWPLPPAQNERELLKWQLAGLAKRYYRILLGDRRNLALLLGQVPVIVLLARVLFATDILDNPRLANKSLNLLFILGTSLVWFGTINAAREICKELPIWERENHVGVRPVPYVLSKVLVLSGLALVQTLILLAMFFILWRVPGGGEAFLGTLVAGFLAAFCGMAVGLAISASAPSPDRAMTLVPVAMIPQIMFGGAVIPLREMGQGQHISVIIAARWAFEALGRLTERGQYLDPTRSLHYSQVTGSWLEPVAALAVLGLAFAGLAVWLVARQASRTQPAGRPVAGPPVPGRALTPGPPP